MKGSRGSVAARLAKRKVATKGQYLFWLTDSATPAIGSVVEPWSGTVAGGYLVAAPGFDGMELSPTTVHLAGSSLLMAFRLVQNEVGANHSVTISGSGVELIAYLVPQGSLEAALNSVFMLAGAPLLPAVGPADVAVVLAYDAVTNRLWGWVNGSQSAAGAAVNHAVSPAFSLLQVTNDSMTLPLNLRDIQVMQFVNAPLPANVNALVAAYGANPLTKLSAWAD